MTSKNNLVPVAGSERLPLPGASSIGPIDPNEHIEVTVRVRRRSHLAGHDIEQMATRLPHQRQHLSHEEYEQTYGAAPKDLEKIENFAREFGLNVVNSSVARRSVVLSGTVADLSKAFAVQLETYQHAGGTYRGRTGTVSVPESIQETVCAAAGDHGSSDRLPDQIVHVDFPSSSPYVLGCGGTRLTASGTTIAEEVVWNDNDGSEATGGGVSDVFELPSWQSAAGIPPSINPGGRIGRGVPDVAGDADPATGYQVRVDGKDLVIGGTSAVAPLWAGLIALINQQLGKSVGYLNPLLYSSQFSKISHDIVQGNNGRYSAQPGWDACTGLGSPNGTLLLQALNSGSNK